MSYTAHFLPDQGLHPKLILIVDAPYAPCPLYTRIHVPPEFIADRFQLRQLHDDGRLGLTSQHDQDRNQATLQVVGERDLEVPASRAGNASVLVRLRQATSPVSLKGKEKQIERTSVEVPLHLRYLKPMAERWTDGVRQDSIQVTLPVPDVFWACSQGESLPSLGSSCAPSTSDLGSFDGLEFAETIHFLRLGNSTASSSCPPKYNVPPLSLTAPTGVLADLPFVEIATFVAVWLGMLWICKAAFWSARPMQEKGSAGAERFVATSSRDKRKITRKQE